MTNTRIDAFLRRLVDRGKTPGAQYARVDSSGTLQAYCAGWADLGQRRPLTNTTPMMAYSMSKVLTASAVSALEREGRVRYDDPLARYGIDTYGDAVTIRHLLEHRSGIPNPIPLRWVHPASAHVQFDERKALEEVLRCSSRLRFPPGAKGLYSNIGYWLLGRLVEQVSGGPFRSYVEERLLEPLGIGPEEIAYRFPADGRQAHGYLERYSLLNLLRPLLTAAWIHKGCEGRWVRIEDHYVNGPAFGGAIGTASGFCRFAWHLIESGEAGFGWQEGPTCVQKEGGGAGFHCLLRLDRRRRRASVLMSNATGLDVSACLDRIDSLDP